MLGASSKKASSKNQKDQEITKWKHKQKKYSKDSKWFFVWEYMAIPNVSLMSDTWVYERELVKMFSNNVNLFCNIYNLDKSLSMKTLEDQLWHAKNIMFTYHYYNEKKICIL